MKTLLVVTGLGALAAKVVIATVVVMLQVVQPADPVSNLVTFAGGLGVVAVLGAVKHLDTSVTNSSLYRKLQPLIALGGTFAVPWAAAHLGVALDPNALANAPLATVVSIGAAELLSLLQRKTGGGV